MEENAQNQAVPAVAAAVGGIGISTALYVSRVGTTAKLPWLVVSLLAILVYTGYLLMRGKLESVKQWAIGLFVMVGVQLCLGLATGIVFFFARPSDGQVESLVWAIYGYGPAAILQIVATIGVCSWIPRLLELAPAPPIVNHILPQSYDSRDLGATVQATMTLRAGMMERVSTASRSAVRKELERVELEAEVAPAPEDELLAGPPATGRAELAIQSSGHRYRVMNGKLVADDSPAEPAPAIATTESDPEERVPRVAREIAWDAPITEIDPETRVPSAKVLAQIPEGCLSVPEGADQIPLRFAQRDLAPQLAEGAIWVRADKVLAQLPPEWLIRPVDEIIAAIEDGYLELPLKPVLEQMPWAIFALPNQRPASDLPGAEFGVLFREAA